MCSNFIQAMEQITQLYIDSEGLLEDKSKSESLDLELTRLAHDSFLNSLADIDLSQKINANSFHKIWHIQFCC